MSASRFRIELLKLCKRPAFVLWLALGVGAVLALVSVRFAFHSSSPGTQGFHGPPGGGAGYRAAIEGQFRFAFFAALLIGAASGRLDRASGVLRELVATGASRLRLFLMRLPTALLVAETLAVVGFAVAVIAGLLLPAGGRMPGAGPISHDVALLLLTVATATLVALALATLLRSAVAAIVVFFVFETTVAPFLLHDDGLGRLRWLLLTPALNRFARPELNLDSLGIPLALAAVVVVGWITILTAAAAWRESVSEL